MEKTDSYMNVEQELGVRHPGKAGTGAQSTLNVEVESLSNAGALDTIAVTRTAEPIGVRLGTKVPRNFVRTATVRNTVN
jgi:hypothetical protein